MLAVTFLKAKMQEKLNFILLMVDEKNQEILRTQDHIPFPNGLIKFLVNFNGAHFKRFPSQTAVFSTTYRVVKTNLPIGVLAIAASLEGIGPPFFTE